MLFLRNYHPKYLSLKQNFIIFIGELPDDAEDGIINQALMKITLESRLITNAFFIKLFRSPYMQENIFGKAWGTAIPNMVGLVEIKKILIPLPPLSEQHCIVAKLGQLMKFCDELEQTIKENKEQINLLLQSALRAAL
jgi:type I restriction enzyme S subunit